MASEDWRDEIRTLLQTHNLQMKAVSLAAGKGETFVRDILKRDRTPSTENLQDVRDAIARLAGRVPLGPSKSEVTASRAEMPLLAQLPKDIDVLGAAAGSSLGHGSFKFSMDPIDRVARPPGLIGARGVYAVYVENDSMWPKYGPGDLVFVNSFRPPAPGDVIVIQTSGDEDLEFSGFIKTLVRRTKDWIECTQLNPPATLKFRNHPGLSLHRVYTNNELFGI